MDDKSNKNDRLGYTDAAEYCGFSKRTLHYHIRKGRIKQDPDGAFIRGELDAFLALRRLGRKPDKSREVMKETLLRAEIRYRTAKAEREERQLKVLSEEYIPFEVVLNSWVARVHEVKTCLLSFENTLPPILVNKEIHEIQESISREMTSVLERFSRTGRWTPSEYVTALRKTKNNGGKK